MLYEQLSILNPNYYYGCHPLNLRSYLECDPYYEDFNSKFPINISKPKIKDQELTNRRRVLDKILKKISEKDLTPWFPSRPLICIPSGRFRGGKSSSPGKKMLG